MPAAAPAPAADAQANGDDSPIRTIDSGRTQLDNILATLRRDRLDDATLQSLKTQLDPIQTSLQATIARLAPRVDDVKARLAQLGPKPDDKSPPEAPAISADRDAQQTLLAGSEDLLKRARLLALQADQASDAIVSRRRSAFLHDLFERTPGVLSPSLWSAVLGEMPQEWAALRLIGSDFTSRAWSNLAGWRLPGFGGLLALLLAAIVPLSRLAKRILHRAPSITDPDPLHKVLGACWSALVVAVIPVAVVSLALVLSDAFDLVSPKLAPLEHTLAAAVGRVALVAALARGILAPERPAWRLVPIPDAAAERFGRLIVVLAVIVSGMRVVETIHDVIASTVSTTVLARGVGALAVSLATAAFLFGLPDEADGAGDTRAAVSREGRRDWFGFIRLIGWLLAILIFVAAVAGYVAFASFVADQIVWILLVSLAAFLALQVSVDVVDAQFHPHALVGRTLASSVGLRRERLGQIGILLSGALRVIVFVVAALLIVAPWGIQSDDLSGTLRAAYFGFTVGGVTISPSSLVTAIVLFGLAFAATRALQAWLEDRFLPTTALDAGLRNSIRTVVGYVGFIVALSLALAQLGLSFDKLAIVAGALSVGIGFGLQSIVNNFVSGLILLWERAIRVGDWVVVGTDQGFVRRINVRSTEIETFDRAMMIVPNSTLVTGTVKNWVRTDRIGRVLVDVTVQNGADPDKVRDTLIAIARENESVTRLPVPTVLFTDITAGGLSFQLICFVDDVEKAARTKSDLRFAIFKRFGEQDISIAPPAAGPTMVELAPQTQEALMASLQKAAE